MKTAKPKFAVGDRVSIGGETSAQGRIVGTVERVYSDTREIVVRSGSIYYTVPQRGVRRAE